MIKLKKLAALFLSGVMCVSFAFAFAACGDDGTEGGSQTGEQTDNTESGGSDTENGNTNTGNGGGNADADTGNNDGGLSDGESGNESSENTDTESGNSPDGGQSDGDNEEGGSTENSDAEESSNTENSEAEESGDNAETDDTYYGKTYTVDYSALDYYNYDTPMTDEEKADYISSRVLTIALTFYEDGTGTCLMTQNQGKSELNISFDYTAVECTQLSCTYTSVMQNTGDSYTNTYTYDFTGVRFEFSNFVVTKITEDNYDYTDQLSAADMAVVGEAYMNDLYMYGYDGSNVVMFFVDVDSDWLEYYYEEATGNYYYFNEDTGNYYCETTGDYLDEDAAAESDKYTFGYKYFENSAVIGYGALKAAE